jgi:dsDNA-specific endonuclease/ATPase MutS2
VNIWCILHAGTIEELMFDKVATKKDAATICLHGERMPVDFKPIDMNELISQAGDMFNIKTSRDEMEVEQEVIKALVNHKNKEIAA